MTQIRLYIPQPIVSGETVTLSVAQSQHLCKVLRHQAGDTVHVFHPSSGEFIATLLEAHPKTALIKVEACIKPVPGQPLCAIHLGQVISRGDRMDYSIQKATELGVNAITPIISKRCGVKLSQDRLAKRMAHWQGVIESAAQQCGRMDLPTLHPPCLVDDWITTQHADLCLATIVSPDDYSDPLTIKTDAKTAAILIGPEGGFTPEEQSKILQTDFKAWQLGPRILRTETAGVVALALIQARYGDLNT